MEDASSPILTNIIILIVVLALATIFTLLEYSIIKVRPSALRAMQEVRDKPSKKLATAIHMTEHLTEYLSTAQVGITLTSLITGWIGEITFANIIIQSGIFKTLGFGDSLAHTIASILAILLFTFVHAVFTDLVPKNIAISEPARILLAITPIVRFFHITFLPLILFFDKSAWAITNLLGFKNQDDSEIYSQNEILDLTKNSAEAGELDEEDYEFMQRAFLLNDKVVSDIMTDRTQIIALDVDTTIAEAAKIYLEDKFSRFPVVADNDKDNVIGYVTSYDIIRQSRINDQDKLSKIMRDNVSVQENIKITEALREMNAKRSPLAIVVDEYGGTAGIITDKDIYEELFGNFRDEQDDIDDQLIEKLGNDKYKVSGKISLYDLEEYFDTRVTEFDEDESVTLTGFILNNYPDTRKNDVIEIDKFSIKALDYDDAYIEEFEVTELDSPITKNEGSDDSSNENSLN
ncbi:MAG: hemolysin family protein [Lactobacillaceae bacterium]|jgi:CBS domain containing-hemolysin-like protein|nr:hemolysin family protein [Lactobacillaceae bacterium]